MTIEEKKWNIYHQELILLGVIMTTLKLRIDENVLERVLEFLKTLPDKTVEIIQQNEKEIWDIPSVSDEEQKEIEEHLKNPDCDMIVSKETIRL